MRFHLAVLMVCAVSTAQAGDVLIYRCTDTTGALTVQNQPCPKGSQQQVKRMQAVTTVPMTPSTHPSVRPTPAHPAATAPAATITPAASPPPDTTRRLPLPPLFQCTTRDSGSYVTEDSEPGTRCMPLQTVGLDGNPQGGAGQACEVIRDTCARVPDEDLCKAWQKRRDEAEVAWRFTRPETRQKNKDEFERLQRMLEQSTCTP